MTLTPYLDTTTSPPTYKYNNAISFLVQWIPISEIKTQVTKDKDQFEIE